MEFQCPKCERPINLDLGELFDFHLEFDCFKCRTRLIFSSRTAKLAIFTEQEFQKTEKSQRLKDLVTDARELLQKSEAGTRLDARLKIDSSQIDEVLGESADRSATGGLDPEKYRMKGESFFDWKKALLDLSKISENSPEFIQHRRMMEYIFNFNGQACLEIGKKCQALYSLSGARGDFELFQNQSVESFKSATRQKDLWDMIRNMTSRELVKFAASLK